MKAKYVIITLCFCCSFTAFAQNKLFDKYAEIDGITSVYISKTMFQMMPTIENIGLNLVNMQGKIESLQIISTNKQEQIPRMRKDFSQLVKNDHSELMRVIDTGTRATFYATMKGEKVNDLLMLAESDSSYTVIQILGNFTLQDVQEVTKEMKK